MRGLLLVMAVIALPAAAQDECPDTIFNACPCPRGCTESYCEQECPWVGRNTCVYQCRDCKCGAFGRLRAPEGGPSVVRRDWCRDGGFLVRSVCAAEPAASDPGEPQERKVRKVSNAMGEFLILEGGKGAPDESGTIGLVVGMTGEFLVIKSIEPEGPAAMAGLKEGETILSIDGQSTKGMTLENAAKTLRGKPKTLVVLRVKRGWKPWGVKVPLIRSPARPRPKPTDGVSIKEIPLESFGKEGCPASADGCLLLAPSGKYCVFTCQERTQ